MTPSATATATGRPHPPADQAAPTLWAQTHALRATADLLDRIGQPALAVTISGDQGDQIEVHIPERLGPRRARAAIVARLAAAIGARPHLHRSLTGPTAWVQANGTLAGHPIHIYTPITPTRPAKDEPAR